MDLCTVRVNLHQQINRKIANKTKSRSAIHLAEKRTGNSCETQVYKCSFCGPQMSLCSLFLSILFSPLFYGLLLFSKQSLQSLSLEREGDWGERSRKPSGAGVRRVFVRGLFSNSSGGREAQRALLNVGEISLGTLLIRPLFHYLNTPDREKQK